MIYKLRDLASVSMNWVERCAWDVMLRVVPGSVAERIYGQSLITSVTATRFEFNSCTVALAQSGMRVSGLSPDGKFVEIAELPSHPWFVAVQFHPEFQSKPLLPHPLFASFIEASHRHKTGELDTAGVAVSTGRT